MLKGGRSLTRAALDVRGIVVDPKRTDSISCGVNGECYTAAFKPTEGRYGGRFVFSYVGKESVAMWDSLFIK